MGALSPAIRSEFYRERLVEQHALDAEIEPHALVHPEDTADEAARELPERPVVFLDREIVEAARGGDAVLGVDQLAPKLAEVRRGLELWITLRHADQRVDVL